MYCPSCDKEMRHGMVYCPHCSTPVQTGRDNSEMWDGIANPLAQGSLGLAKGAVTVLCGGLAGACGIAATGAFILAGYLFYHFAMGLAVTIPWFLSNTLPVASVSGAPLLLSGITALLVTLLLGMAAAALIRCLRGGLFRNGPSTEKRSSRWISIHCRDLCG